MSSSKKKIVLHIASSSDVDQRTLDIRWKDPRTAPWFSSSTSWTFEGGDALTVVANEFGRTVSWVVLRLGDKIDVYAGSIADALRCEGIEFTVA